VEETFHLQGKMPHHSSPAIYSLGRVLNARQLRSGTFAASAAVIWGTASLLAAPIGVGAAQETLPVVAREVGEGSRYDASPSPDGRHLVYISVVDGREQLWVMNVDGSSPRQITHDNVNHEDPAWSPDGAWIAFVQVSSGRERIYVMQADGSGGEPVTPSDVAAIHPTWSRDSRRLYYCSDDDLHPPKKNPSSVYMIDLASRQVTLIISGGINTYPVLSPDGRKIALRRMISEANSEVFLTDSDGGHAQDLTNHPAFDGWPDWSPDGAHIAFASNRNGNYQIFVMNADGTGVELVAQTEGRATAPHWSPDGSTIYFANCGMAGSTPDCHVMAAEVRFGPPPTR
jgi:TolB protein